MKIGLYFGSFNPIHIGHLVIANHLVQFTDLDAIWFVVTPHNPHKEKKSLLNGYDRLEMTRLALEDYSFLEASDIEFGLTQPNYTSDTLVYLKDKFPNHDFSLIMGSDNLKSFHKWKNYEYILENHKIYVYPRPGFESGLLENPQVNLIKDVPLMEISATYIRKGIKQGKDIRALLPNNEVWAFIDKGGYYL